MQIIKEQIEGLIALYSTCNPFDLCKFLNIKLMEHDLGEKIKGCFHITPDGYRIIYINSKLSEAERTDRCAHELGHALLHTNNTINIFNETDMQVIEHCEKEADLFASELLKLYYSS
ncbi:MAG: ImmA/IrrE family metallo-endopeptidase [Clostridiaceae bacterium]